MVTSFETWLLAREQDQSQQGAPKVGEPPSKVTQAATTAAAEEVRSGKPPVPGQDPAAEMKKKSKEAAAQALEDPDTSLDDVEDAAEIATKMGEVPQGQTPVAMKRKSKKKSGKK